MGIPAITAAAPFHGQHTLNKTGAVPGNN